MASYFRLKLEQMDTGTAVLNTDDEKIYIQFPQGVEVPQEFKKGAPALNLLRKIYGFKRVYYHRSLGWWSYPDI